MKRRHGGSAIIIGGSVAGLLTALLLRIDGWHVDVFERVGVELAGRGAGIVTHADLFAVMRSAGIEITPDLGVSVSKRRIFGRDGARLGEVDYPQILTSWDRLHQALRAKLPDVCYHNGRALERVAQTDSQVVAHFADGTQATADILIGADGFRSATRAQFLPDLHPSYAGYVAWRGLVDENRISPETLRDVFDYFAFSLPEGEQMLGYPVAGQDNDMRVGQRRYNWVWYRPADESTVLRDLLTDAGGTTHDISIPPPLIRTEIIADIRQSAGRTLSPQFQELVALTAQPFFQPIYDLATPRMAFRRVAIIGDAAFVVRPHVGAGVTKAAQDAAALVTALGRDAGDIAAGLLAFEQERLAAGSLIVERARYLGAYMQSQVTTPQERRNAELGRNPATIMRETASLDFLYANVS